MYVIQMLLNWMLLWQTAWFILGSPYRSKYLTFQAIRVFIDPGVQGIDLLKAFLLSLSTALEIPLLININIEPILEFSVYNS